MARRKKPKPQVGTGANGVPVGSYGTPDSYGTYPQGGGASAAASPWATPHRSAVNRIAVDVAPGYVMLVADSPQLTLTCLMDDSIPSIAGGYGGWTTVERPRHIGLTDWIGSAPFTLTLGLMIDGLAEGRSVEHDVHTLHQMGIVNKGTDHEPPLLAVYGSFPSTDLDWVIQDISWGTADRLADGDRVRQQATVSLLQYVEGPELKQTPVEAAQGKADPKDKGKGKGKGHGKSYTVKTGDTLKTIAAKELGDIKKWHELAKLNNIRDPAAIKAGDTLKLP